MGDNFRENIMLTIKLFDALISPILLYGSEICGVDCNDQIEKDPAELVQIKFLKWLLGVNKYCSNNARRAESVLANSYQTPKTQIITGGL